MNQRGSAWISARRRAAVAAAMVLPGIVAGGAGGYLIGAARTAVTTPVVSVASATPRTAVQGDAWWADSTAAPTPHAVGDRWWADAP